MAASAFQPNIPYTFSDFNTRMIYYQLLIPEHFLHLIMFESLSEAVFLTFIVNF